MQPPDGLKEPLVPSARLFGLGSGVFDKLRARHNVVPDTGSSKHIDERKDIREMLHFDENGVTTRLEFHKHDIIRDLSIRHREAFMLDPLMPLPFPAALMIREKAIIVNLEAFRMIICANQTFVLSVPKASDPSIPGKPKDQNPFIILLKACLTESDGLEGDTPTRSESDGLLLRLGGEPSMQGILQMGTNLLGHAFDADAPYELRVLEVVFRCTVHNLRVEAQKLQEEKDSPELAGLANKVNAASLQKLHHLKDALEATADRVKAIRAQVQGVLDDDVQLNNLFLSRAVEKGVQSLPPQPKEVLERRDGEAAALGSLRAPSAQLPRVSMRALHLWKRAIRRAVESTDGSNESNLKFSALVSEAMTKSGGDVAAGPLSGFSTGSGVEAAADLLEATFMHLDDIIRQLQVMSGQIASDELLIRIMMDQRRNLSVWLQVLVSTISMAFGWVAMVAGVFGMNLFNVTLVQTNEVFFWWVIGCSTFGLLALPVLVMTYMHQQRITLTFDQGL